MKSYDLSTYIYGQSYIVVKNEIATEISQAFLDMAQYPKEELLNKDIKELIKILRVGPDTDIENIEVERDYFIFTKSLEARFISIEIVKEEFEKIFILTEKQNSRLNVKFSAIEALCSHNVIGVAVFSAPDITLLKANQTYLNFLDKPFNSMKNSIGKRIHEIIPGWTGSSSEDIWRNVLSTQKPFYSDEYMFEFERGVTYWQASLAPVFENGILKYCIEITTDVTEKVLNRRRLKEQAKIIEQQKNELEAIIENVSEGLILFNADGSVEFLNEEAKKFVYNYGHYKKVGESYNHTEYFDMNGDPIALNDLPGVRAMKGEKVNNYIFSVKRPDKTVYYSASGSPIYDSEGNVVSGLLCARDVTELVNNQKKILEQKLMNEIIIENTYENIYVLDSNGKYLVNKNNIVKEVSTNFESVEELCKVFECYDLDGNEIHLNGLPTYRVLNREIVENEIVHVKGKGFEYYVIINGAPICDEKGNLLYAIITGRNVTELIKSQQDLKSTQEKLLDLERQKNEALENAMEMKDEFLSVISHEFRTPLNVINTAIQTLNLVYQDQLTDKVKTYIGTIRQNTNRQLRLVNNLLDITRSNAGRIKINKNNIDIVFLTKAITESVYEYASRRGVRVTFVPKLTKKIIGIDDEKYERIILNLLSNAIKFTPEGKSIVVSLRTVKSSVCIEVMDKGIGIPQDKIDVIFERFGQVDSSLSRQAEGTGIGLSLVNKFVEALGGCVTVKSKMGKGTTFKILLPDKTVVEEDNEKPIMDLMNDNRLVQNTNIEFSDIYL